MARTFKHKKAYVTKQLLDEVIAKLKKKYGDHISAEKDKIKQLAADSEKFCVRHGHSRKEIAKIKIKERRITRRKQEREFEKENVVNDD